MCRYRRAAVGSNHDDLHPGNSALNKGAVRPQHGLVTSLFFTSPRMCHVSFLVFEVLPAFSCISWKSALLAGGYALILYCGLIEAEGDTIVPPQWAALQESHGAYSSL
jgi:hypothetical protein